MSAFNRPNSIDALPEAKIQTVANFTKPANQEQANSRVPIANSAKQEIEPLRRKPPAAESYPLEALGNIIGSAAKSIERVIQAPAALCGQSVLAAAAVCVQGITNVQLYGGTSPLSNFFISIAESGERKSAVDRCAMAGPKEFQKQLYERYQQDLQDYDIDMDVYDKNSKELSKKGSGDALKASLHELIEPQNPIQPVIFAGDPTFEGLVKMLAVGQPSAGIFSDEGGGMLGGSAMNEQNRLKTVASLSRIWDGTPIDRVRAGDGASILYDRRCSAHLMMQPRVADSFLNDAISSDQGILSRFLCVRPKSTKGSRLYVDEDLSIDTAVSLYKQRSLELMQRWKIDEETGGVAFSKPLEMTQDAKAIWVAFGNYVESEQAEEGTYRQISGLASKASEHAARLAGIIQIFENPTAVYIDIEHMKLGIELMNFYLTEAIRIKQAALDSDELMEAEKLLTWFKEEKIQLIYPAKIYQFGPASLRSKKKASEIIDVLVDHGYLTLEEKSIAVDGKVRKKLWRVKAYSVDEVL